MVSVVILLGTLNGAKFLPSQLQSFEQQEFTNWQLIASDDGSADGTNSILSQFRERLGPSKVDIRSGPRRGFVSNFLALACDRTITGDYYAFADQDDIWEPDKLSRALSWLEQVPSDVPALWCSRTRLIDEQGRHIGYSSLFKLKPSFQNALVQSIAGANTMVFNAAARRLLAVGGDRLHLPAHDWWLYMLTTAAGGKVKYDLNPSIRYRLHAENLIGSNLGLGNRGNRLIMVLRGRFKHWNDLNTAALVSFRPHMTAENRNVFDLFYRARQQRSLIRRGIDFYRSGVHRQTLLGNLGLVVAICANKI